MIEFRFFEELRGRKLPLVDSEDIPNLFRDCSYRSRRVANDIKDFLDLYPAVKPLDCMDVSARILERFESLLYCTAEFAEFFERITKYIPITRDRKYKSQISSYHSAIKGHFRDWNLICNKIKHNGNQIIPTAINYTSGEFSLGYALVKPKGKDSLEINKDFHRRGERCRSYIRDVRKILFDISKADRSLSELIKALDDVDGCEILEPPSSPFVADDTLTRIDRILPTAFNNESAKLYSFYKKAGEVHWDIVSRPAPVQQATVQFRYIADGMTRHFPII